MGMMLRGFWHHVLAGSRGAAELHEAVNLRSIDIGLYVVGDAHAVYTAITAAGITVPNDKSELLAVRTLRDRLDCGLVTRLLRCDTRYMLCDALTKGSVARSAIVEAFGNGFWRMEIIDQVHAWPDRRWTWWC